jgi:hypothetical protein
MSVLQPGRGVADHVLGADDLVEVFRVHEMEAFAVLVEEGVVAVVDEGALDLLGGAPPLRHLHPVGDAAHVQLGDRRALAGVDVLGREDDVELALHIDDGAFAERAGGYLHVSDPWLGGKRRDEPG